MRHFESIITNYLGTQCLVCKSNLIKNILKDIYQNYVILQIMQLCFVQSIVTVRCRAVHHFYFVFCSLSLIVQRCFRAKLRDCTVSKIFLSFVTSKHVLIQMFKMSFFLIVKTFGTV